LAREQLGKPQRSRLRLFPLVTLSALFAPIVIGLAGTWLPAVGYLPAIGSEQFSLGYFHDVFDHPSFAGAQQVTLLSGFSATLAALAISLWIVIQTYGTGLWRILLRMLSPLLALPHAAFAIGFAFLVAPSGWLMRFVSPELSGFMIPPDWLTVKDPYGISLILALVLKEVPFLLLMSIGALNQLDVKRILWVGRSFGYSRIRIWFRLVIPQLYPQIRLPVLAVLAYSLSVVDVAMILGPSLPPTLAVLIDRWFNDPDVAYRLLGAAGATWLFCLVGVSIALVFIGEHFVRKICAPRLINGQRDSIWDRFGWSGAILTWILMLVSLLSLLVLIIWSCTRSWRFPDILPAAYSSRFWLKGIEQAADPLLVTAIIGLATGCVAIILVIGCLEYEVLLLRSGRRSDKQWVMWLVYLPLLVPQIAFLFGIQTVAVLFHIEGHWASMIGIHLVFVLPYTFLTLSGVYRKYDARYSQVAVGLGGSVARSFFRVKLPMLLKPIAFALATGFAVSVSQYLPTLYIGAGRFSTITTETVGLASGSDRRIVAVYALCQFLLPMLIYCTAILGPAWLFKDRKGMQN